MVVARYQGKCAVCHQQIDIGEEIRSAFGSGWMHSIHSDAEAAATITLANSRTGNKFKPKTTRTPRSCVICSARAGVKQVKRRDGSWVWACDVHRAGASFA